MTRRAICIIGAGNGGSAIAGDMTLAGHSCRLFEFPQYAHNIQAVIAQRGIKVTGIARTGFAQLDLATTDLAEAVEGAELIMVATQALAHERFAREVAPLLEEGQTVILWPGSGGALAVRKVWDELGLDREVLLAEGVTFDDFTRLGPEVMLSGIALCLTDDFSDFLDEEEEPPAGDQQ